MGADPPPPPVNLVKLKTRSRSGTNREREWDGVSSSPANSFLLLFSPPFEKNSALASLPARSRLPFAVRSGTLMGLKIKGQYWADANGFGKHVHPCGSLV